MCKKAGESSIWACQSDTEGVRTLADLLSRDALPALKTLRVERDPTMTNAGVLALAEGLLKALRTFLTSLRA